jgi:hypothetical protein
MRGQNPLYRNRTLAKPTRHQSAGLSRSALDELTGTLWGYIHDDSWRETYDDEIESFPIDWIQTDFSEELEVDRDEIKEAVDHLINQLKTIAQSKYNDSYDELDRLQKRDVLINTLRRLDIEKSDA